MSTTNVRKCCISDPLAAEAMTHIGGDSFPKQTGTQQRKETEAESTVENSNAGPVVWNVGDVAWLCAENHTEWPCVVGSLDV